MGEFLIAKYNYFVYVLLLMIGIYGMMAKRNLMKKLIGMSIFQWAIILFFISISAKRGGTIPIVDIQKAAEKGIQALDYVNPLPHVLMLTAIVVGVATTGIALAFLIIIYNRYGTLEENEIIEALRK